MKYKDYVRLAKLHLNERKKTTKNSILGISFGLILLIPLLFITLSFYLDMNKTVNANSSIRNFNVGIIEQKDDTSTAQFMLDEYVEKVSSMKGVKTSIQYQSYAIKNNMDVYDEENDKNYVSSCVSFKYNDQVFDFEQTNDASYSYKDIGLEVYSSEKQYMSYENALLKGDGFSSHASNEIMVSTAFIDYYHLDMNGVIGSLLSSKMKLSSPGYITSSPSSIDDDFEDEEGEIVSIFEDFKIVGVFDSNIYKETIRTQYSSNDSEVYFWFDSSALYGNGDSSYLPKKIYFERKGINGYVFKTAYFYYLEKVSDISNYAMNNKCLFLPIEYGVDTNTKIDSKLILEMNNYKNASVVATAIEEYIKQSTTKSNPDLIDYFMDDSFSSYRTFYKVFTYVSIAFAIFGGVVFFTNLLNMYNTINNAVQSNTNYIGLCRAIGMKSADIVKLYFIELLEIFKKSYLWGLIFGGGISLIIKFVFGYIMSSDVGTSIAIKFSLNPIYILVSFIIIVIFDSLIALIFSFITTNNVANKPILDTLINDK